MSEFDDFQQFEQPTYERLVWIFTPQKVFMACVLKWQLEDDGTTVWQGEKVNWKPVEGLK